MRKIVLVFLLISQVQFAFCGELDYPELMVTPRASERVRIEAAKEPRDRWTRHAAIQASALTTLVAASMQISTSSGDNASKILGFTVGSSWIVTTLALSNFYTPYQTSLDELNGMPAKTQRESLTKERTAEETIYRAGKLGSNLSLLSFGTNFLASAYMLTRADKSTKSFPIDFLAVLTSFSPLIFSSSWQVIANDHRDYKKRIYGPVASATLLPEAATGKVVPGVALSMNW